MEMEMIFLKYKLLILLEQVNRNISIFYEIV